jgi:hypothetical protein
MNAQTWADTVSLLRGLGPSAEATAELLEMAEPSWNAKIIPHYSMSGLTFNLRNSTNLTFPELTLSWTDEVFEFQLFDTSRLVAADRCLQHDAPHVLDSFLEQLVQLGA